jgi:hypothetical protein
MYIALTRDFIRNFYKLLEQLDISCCMAAAPSWWPIQLGAQKKQSEFKHTLDSKYLIFNIHSRPIMASSNMNFNSSDEQPQSTSFSIISGEPLDILEKVNETKNICVDGVALSGMVMEALAVKFDKMHHNLMGKMTE